MAALDFMHNLATIRALTPDFMPVTVEPRDHYFSLGLGLTGRCNFQCPICYYHGPEGSAAPNDMPLPLLKSLLTPLPQLASISIGLEGEPFCHPCFFDALDIMSAHADQLNIISNGSLLDVESCKRLSEYPIGSFALSIDAGDEAAYRRFRKGGELGIFQTNGATLVEQLGDRVGFHTVIFAENTESLTRLPELAAKMGVQWISLQQLRPTYWTSRRMVHPIAGEQIKAVIKSIINAAEKKEIALLFDQRFGNKRIMQFIRKMQKECEYIKIQQEEIQSCSQILQFTSILSNGQIFPCCGDFSSHDISAFSFDGIFNHEYLQRLRYLHKKNKLAILPCLKCRYGDK